MCSRSRPRTWIWRNSPSLRRRWWRRNRSRRQASAANPKPLFRLLKAKQKLVGVTADRRIEHILGVIVVLVRQNGALAIQLEAGCQHIRLDPCRIDTVQRLGCSYT